MKTIDKQTALHYQWGDNCDSWVLVDTKGLSVKQERLPSGAKEQLHYHCEAQQFFFILKGIATFYLNNEKICVAEQQGLLLPVGIKHFIVNETDERLDILVISQPTTNNDRITIE